jgi:hypothetical protein
MRFPVITVRSRFHRIQIYGFRLSLFNPVHIFTIVLPNICRYFLVTVCVCVCVCVCYMFCPPHFSWFNHSNSKPIVWKNKVKRFSFRIFVFV